MVARIIAAALALAVLPATAQDATPPCASYRQAARHMAMQFREVEIAVAIIDDEDGAEREARLFASRDGLTWSLIAEDENGCWTFRASGKDWRALAGRPA